jgi:hypothetical protein
MPTSVTLKIPNKEKHIADRDPLQQNHSSYVSSIGELTTIRSGLLIQKQPTAVANITLDDAVTILEKYQREVDGYNTRCQSTKNGIIGNNEALQRLLRSITTEIEQAKAVKAAADAAAAVAAKEAAALRHAKNALQEYIASLQSQLDAINNINIDDIAGQIQSSADTIIKYGPDLDTAVYGAGEAISRNTREAITEFKGDTVAKVNSNTQGFTTLKQEFGQAKETIVTELNAKIRALQSVAGGTGVTAEAIQAALDADKKKPIDDEGLGDIKRRAAELATGFGAKVTTDFAMRKAAIEGKIDEDKKLFQEKQQITEEFKKIKDIFDSEEFKQKEAAIQEIIRHAQDAENVAVNESGSITMTKMLKNAHFGTVITSLNIDIFSLEKEVNKIQNLETKLKDLQARSAKIPSPPIDVAPIQARLGILDAAKAEYTRLHRVQETRANMLSAENAAGRSRSPSPETAQIRPAPPSSPPPDVRRPPRQQPQPKLPEDDPADSSVPEPKRTPGRRYSIFIPTPVKRKPSTTRADAAAADNTDNTEDAIDQTVLEIFVYEDENHTKPRSNVSTDDAAKNGGGFIQRGGEPPKVAKIIKVKQITPEIQNLFLSFKTPKEILTPDFLDSIEENQDSSTEVVDLPTMIDVEMTKKKADLIQNDDTTEFLESLGKKVDHKSTIMKLMKWMTIELGKSENKYETLYEELWRFMDYTDCVIILKKLISDYENKMKLEQIKQTERPTTNAKDKKGLQQILGWTSRSTNTLYDNLLMEISKCEELLTTSGSSKQELRDTGKYSTFIHNRFQGRGYRFMLNWLILIALHVYNAEKIEREKMLLLDHCGEFIEKLYNVFIQWMSKIKENNQGDLDNMFDNNKPKLVYTENVTRLITADIFGDSTVMRVIVKMRNYMCQIDKTGTRESKNTSTKENSTKPKRPVSASRVLSGWLPPPPTEPLLRDSDFDSDSETESVPRSDNMPSDQLFTRTGGPVVPTVGQFGPPLSSSKDASNTTAGATTMSPSPRQAWMQADATSHRTLVRVRGGPKTPPSPSARRSLDPSEKFFEHVPLPSNVPPLQLQKVINSDPVKIQSARLPPQKTKTPQDLSADLDRYIKPNSARLPPRPGNITSQRPGNVNIHNRFRSIRQSGSFLPGDNVDSQPVGHPNSEGTGNLDFLSAQSDDTSEYVVLSQQKPTHPKSEKPSGPGLSVTQKNRLFKGAPKGSSKGGHKRTRKHRTPASSTPAPPTRRRHHSSSSSQKRTRRQRRESIRT